MAQTRAWVLDLDAEHRVAVGNQHMVEYIIDSEVEIIPVPLAPAYAPGVMVWQQQIIPVIDIGKMLRPAETDLGEMTGVMILAYQQAPGEPLKHGALVLRSAPQTTSVSRDMACPLPERPLAWQSLALACFTEQDQAIPILDAKQVFSAALREIYRTSQAALEVDAAIAAPAWEQTTAGEAMADEPRLPDVAEPLAAEGPPTAAAPVGSELSVPQEHSESEKETAFLAAGQPPVDTGMTRLDETETVGSPDCEPPGPDTWQQPVKGNSLTMGAEPVDTVQTGADLLEPGLPDDILRDDDIQVAASLESAGEQLEQGESGAEANPTEKEASSPLLAAPVPEGYPDGTVLPKVKDTEPEESPSAIGGLASGLPGKNTEEAEESLAPSITEEESVGKDEAPAEVVVGSDVTDVMEPADVPPTMSETLSENRDSNSFAEQSMMAAEPSPMEAEDAVNSTEPEERRESDLSTNWVNPPNPAAVSRADNSRAETPALFEPEPVAPEPSTPTTTAGSEQAIRPLPGVLPKDSEAVCDDSTRTGSDGQTIPDEDAATTPEFSGVDVANDPPDIPGQRPELLAADSDEAVTPRVRKRWTLPRHHYKRLTSRRVKPRGYRPGSPARTRPPELRTEPVDEKSLGNDAAEDQGKPSWKAWRK